jgi:DNA-binding transcriptional LysR family regulator
MFGMDGGLTAASLVSSPPLYLRTAGFCPNYRTTSGYTRACYERAMISRKFEYLIALAKERHFARAAAICRVSQPALSAAIQQLEIELGVEIVKHGRRFEGFTQQGEIVLEWARKLAADCDRLHERLRERPDTFSGTLHVGALWSTVPLIKMFTLPFQKRFPNTNLKITGNDAFEIAQALEKSSSMDVVVTYIDSASHQYSHSHVLYTEEYELLIRRGTRFSGQKSVSWDALKQLPLCLFSPDNPLFGAEESEMLNSALNKTPHVITNNIWLLMDHVRTGNWASVLPRPVRSMVAGDQELEAIPLPKSGTPPSIGIAVPRREPASPLAQAFFEIATSEDVLRRLRDVLYPIDLKTEDLKLSRKRKELPQVGSKGSRAWRG